MKEKYIVLGMFITFLFIIPLWLVNMFKVSTRTIYVKEIFKYSEKVIILKEKNKKVKKEECQKDITRMIEKMNDTYFDDKVSLKKYYNAYYQEDNFSTIFEDIVTSCSLEADVKDEIYIDVLASTVYPEKIKEEMNLRYEWKWNDFYSRRLLEKSMDETGTYVTKTLELNIINNILDEVLK